jgi:peptidyl-prolyl cis-trans isomerase C
MARRLVVALSLLAAFPAARADDSLVAVRVNGVAIGRERVERYFEDYLAEKGRSVAGIRSPAAYEGLYREALEKLVEAELLWQEAERRKLVAPRAEVDAALAEVRAGFKTAEAFRSRLERGGFTEATYADYLRKQLSIRKLVQKEIVARVEVRDDEVHEFYEANPARFTRPEQVRARHVLVKVAPAASEDERTKARARIEAVLADARGGASFEDLARMHSDDATAARGGDLGFFARGQMVRPFEEAAFALAPGEISGVVETPFGFHVIQVAERRGGERIAEAEARGAIRERLRTEKAERALAERVAKLRERGRVEIAAR